MGSVASRIGTWRARLAVSICGGGAVLAFLSLFSSWSGHLPTAEFFALTSENNLPTWYTTVVMLAVAFAAAVAGWLARSRSRAMAVRWWIFAGLFALLSLDEMAALHERLEPLGARILHPTGFFYFVWVVPGIVLAAVVVVAVLQLARALATPVRRELVLGIALFLGAALGLEMLGGMLLEGTEGQRNIPYPPAVHRGGTHRDRRGRAGTARLHAHVHRGTDRPESDTALPRRLNNPMPRRGLAGP